MIQVLLVTQQQCAFCVQAKDLLTHLAREYELSVSTLDVQSPQGEALALHSGLLFPPGIFLMVAHLSASSGRNLRDGTILVERAPPVFHLLTSDLMLRLAARESTHRPRCWR